MLEDYYNDFDGAPSPTDSPLPCDDIVPTVDLYDLKLDVERIQFKWDDEHSRYDVSPDLGDSTNQDSGDTPHYAPTHAFAIARTFTPTDHPNVFSVSKKVHAWSPHFVKAARAVMEGFSNIPWGAKPLKLDPDLVLSFLPKFEKYLYSLQQSTAGADDDTSSTISQLSFFIDLMKKEYASKLDTLATLLAERQVTFNYVWGIFVPGTILITHCDTTGEPLVVRLISCTFQCGFSKYWQLQCENVDVDGSGLPGYADHFFTVQEFSGAENITDLPAFPMEPYLEESQRKELCAALIKRGRRYWDLAKTWCHKEYNGIAHGAMTPNGKMTVQSRIMLDRQKYSQYGPGGSPPTVKRDLDGKSLNHKALTTKNDVRRVELTDEELLLMPAKLYGFSLADRKWLLFNVEHIEDIHWNMEAFEHLDIDSNKKEIVKTLIESHTQKAAQFDDFVPGKGLGLIFALHGPPGVGKTLTAEATSEVAKSPLYMVGAGDLGTTAHELDDALTTLLNLASAWKAIVLIDEADVFLERRDVHDLMRNAMVAVFLRQLEYYTGILILTTNRLSIVDPAMKSRIHVSLQYEPLNLETRERLWEAFLQKAGLHGENVDAVDIRLMQELCQRSLNGRAIKNVIKTATTFAAYHGRTVGIHDILRVVRITDDIDDDQ